MLSALLAVTMFVSAAEPLLSGEIDTVRYAITQGGLFAVCLVLLYWLRNLTKERLLETKEWADARDRESKERDRTNTERHEENLQRMELLTNIVRDATSAATLNAAAVRELVRTVERLERLDR